MSGCSWSSAIAVLASSGTAADPGADLAPDLGSLLRASCSRGDAPPTGVPAQVESVPVADAGGTEVARVVAVGPLDAPALAELRGRLGLGTGLAVVSSGRPAAAAGGAVPPSLGRDGVVAGQRVRVAPAGPGLPYGLAVWTPEAPASLPLVLGLVVIAALVVCGVLLLVVASRLTRPLLGLAGVAERLRQGDLAARS